MGGATVWTQSRLPTLTNSVNFAPDPQKIPSYRQVGSSGTPPLSCCFTFTSYPESEIEAVALGPSYNGKRDWKTDSNQNLIEL